MQIMDAEALGLGLDEIQKEIGRFQPDVVGMPTFATNLHVCHRIAEMAKQVNSEVTVILGGAHVSIDAARCVGKPAIDIGIYGEGEVALISVLRVLASDLSLASVKGIIWKNGEGRLVVNPPEGLSADINRFPMPAWHLLALDRYCGNVLQRGRKPLNMITSRGCPYRCTFCSSPRIFGQSFRYLGTERVVEEMRRLTALHGADSLQFCDETFTVNRKRVIDLCDALIEEHMRIPWSCFTRVNLVDEELLAKMKAAGCYLIMMGIESGVQRILNLMKKDHTVEQCRRARSLCKETGIWNWFTFMIGFPTETREESRQTIDFAIELDSEFAHFPIFTPFPGTAAYEIASEHGMIVNRDLSEYHTFDSGIYSPRPDRSAEDVRRTAHTAYRAFYIRPGYLLRRMADVPFNYPPRTIWRFARTAFRML